MKKFLLPEDVVKLSIFCVNICGMSKNKTGRGSMRKKAHLTRYYGAQITPH